jgi:hypothetical protein
MSQTKPAHTVFVWAGRTELLAFRNNWMLPAISLKARRSLEA